MRLHIMHLNWWRWSDCNRSVGFCNAYSIPPGKQKEAWKAIKILNFLF